MTEQQIELEIAKLKKSLRGIVKKFIPTSGEIDELKDIILRLHALCESLLDAVLTQYLLKTAGKKVDNMKDFDEYYEALEGQKRWKHTADGVESDEQTVSRLITFLKEAALTHPGKTLLVVSHGHIMHLFLIYLGFGTYQNFPLGAIENTAYIKIESDGVDFFLKETKGVKSPTG